MILEMESVTGKCWCPGTGLIGIECMALVTPPVFRMQTLNSSLHTFYATTSLVNTPSSVIYTWNLESEF